MAYMNTVEFSCGDERLEGIVLGRKRDERPGALFLHGAGQATKERALPLARRLAETGTSSFLFDFSGHGASTGSLEESSLIKRTQEARAALAFCDRERPLRLFGFSMGGHVALELLPHLAVSHLVLFYPAVYAEEAFKVPFGSGFSEIIRRPGSWQDAAVMRNLDGFEGSLLVVIGENDEVIPPGVVDSIMGRAMLARRKEFLTVPGAGHQLLGYLAGHPDEEDRIFNKVTSFVEG